MEKRQSRGKGLDCRVRRVVIDPAHGDFDPGALGKGGLEEKDVALDIALALPGILRDKMGMEANLTRRADHFVALSDRAAAANGYRAELFVSIHVNAAENRGAGGLEPYFCSGQASGREAARAAAFENAAAKYDDPVAREPGCPLDLRSLFLSMEQDLHRKRSGDFAGKFRQRCDPALPFQSQGVQSADFFVLRRIRMAAILLEAGFLSNPENEKRLARPDFRRSIAMAFAKGFAA